MRKSKMIGHLISILRGVYPRLIEEQSTYSTRLDAEYILERLEEYGMLPPYVDSAPGEFVDCVFWESDNE